jgi:PKD repeat protein
MYDLVASSARPATPLPGRIEAEDFDYGGEGVAYHDEEPANLGGVYRPAEGVDIEPMPDSTGFNVGWVRPGEWLRYTVDVSTPGAYTVRLRAASRWGEQSLSLELDGEPAVTLPVANLASFDDFAVTNATLALTAGQHRLRAVPSGYCNLDYIEFELRDAPVRFPGAVADPRDLDGDGLYEDVNGNGRRDFADVVLYFDQMGWIGANEPPGCFDYNDNGRIDFADVARLFAGR